MARRAVLGGGSLNPFGGTGVDFGAFDIGGTDRESTLILTRVEVQWEAGQATDAQYLDALKAYATTLTPNTSERLNADARVESMKYRVERGVLVSQIDAGTKKLSDLLSYDNSKLQGLNHDSEEYRQRLSQYQGTQQAYYQDLEQGVVKSYNDGHMTTAQLNAWYQARKADPNLQGNLDLTKSIDDRIHELGNRLTDERDSKTVQQYQDGKMSPAAFIAYATQARSRYVAGSQDYETWNNRLNDANQQQAETGLLYRYDLSQQYAQLQKFVASSKAPSGGKGYTSKSKSTRVVLGADGKWHTKTIVTSKYHPPAGPTAAEQKAMHDRNIEVADAKRQMAEIQRKIGGVGGFVSTDSVIHYYQGQLGKFAKGSDEWYQIQGKLDQLNDRKHQETVLAREGIRISYPKTSAPSSAGGGGAGGGSKGTSSPHAAASPAQAHISVESFMAAIAKVESGGRYNATNKSTGAHGKYQIMPANWPGWASKYLGNANAPQTPENQEKVARGKMLDLYKWLGDWQAVAHWWLTGGSNKANHLNPATWSTSSTNYVNKVMAGLGSGPVSSSSLYANSAGTVGGGVHVPAAAGPQGVGGTKASAANTKLPMAKQIGSGPLKVIVGTSRPGPKGSGGNPIVTRTGFPVNLDGEAFKKFYAQYEQAFKSGATEFSINTPSGEVHYFVGDDAMERIEGMRQMDTLRIQLFQERMKAYQGTASEITAANQFDGAVEDAAKHELIILDTYEQKGTKTGAPGRNVTPIGTGIATLEKTVAAIKEHMALANAAMQRGELTTAYSHFQLAEDLAAQNSAYVQGYAQQARANIAGIEKAYGVSASEALGKSGYDQLQTDLAQMDDYQSEIDKAMADGKESRDALFQVVKKDQTGAPVFDQRGPGGQLQLAPGYYWDLKPNGTVEAVKAPVSGVDNNGKVVRNVEGKVKIDYVSGNTTIQAYADWKVGQVGTMIAPDGVTRVPIMGKIVTRQEANGEESVWFENPFNPGAWSSKPISYKAPASFKAVPGQGGSTVFQFDGMQDAGRGNGAVTASGDKLTLMFDPKTGTYVMYRSNSGGLFGIGATDNEELGSLVNGSFAAQMFKQGGFSRDLTGMTSDDLTLTDLGSPFVGGDAKEYKQWRNNFQSPVPTGPRSELDQMHAEQQLARQLRAGQAPLQNPLAGGPALNAQGGVAGGAYGPFTSLPSSMLNDATASDMENRRGYGPGNYTPPALKPLPQPSQESSRPIPLTAVQRAGEQNRLSASLAAADAKAKAQAAANAKLKAQQAAQAKRDAAANKARLAASRAAANAKAKAAAAKRAAAAKQAASHQAITGHAIGHGALE